MEQRDIIKDQIEQMGKMIAKLISNFLNLKSEGQAIIGIQSTNEALQKEANIDVEVLLSLEENDLLTYLENQKFNSIALDNLAEYFLQLAEHHRDKEASKSLKIYQQALILLNFSEKEKTTFSFDRFNRTQKLKDQIEQLRNNIS